MKRTHQDCNRGGSSAALVTMEAVVLASKVMFLFVDASLSCLELFQSMLTKIMFAAAVLCSNDRVPCSVAAADVEADHTDTIALVVE